MTGPCPSGCGRSIDYRTGCAPCTRKACVAMSGVLLVALACIAVLP